MLQQSKKKNPLRRERDISVTLLKTAESSLVQVTPSKLVKISSHNQTEENSTWDFLN